MQDLFQLSSQARTNAVQTRGISFGSHGIARGYRIAHAAQNWGTDMQTRLGSASGPQCHQSTSIRIMSLSVELEDGCSRTLL